MVRRIWTLAEAEASLFQVQALLREARVHVHRMRQAQAAMQSLRDAHGDAVVMPDHPAHADHLLASREFHHGRERLGAVLAEFDALGVELKDVDAGLVDFRAGMGGKEVYLCWVDGEDHIAHWHTLDAGFRGRQPIPELERPQA